MDLKTASERIDAAIASGDGEALREAVFEAETVLLDDAFPGELFEQLIALLDRSEFLRLEGSHHLLRLIPGEWETLGEDQRERLLTAIERAYPRFADWMSWFVISEILGENYADERALAALCRLAGTSEEGPRSLVPHGLEHIIRDSGDVALAERARKELDRLARDRSERVRGEVAESMARLKRR